MDRFGIVRQNRTIGKSLLGTTMSKFYLVTIDKGAQGRNYVLT